MRLTKPGLLAMLVIVHFLSTKANAIPVSITSGDGTWGADAPVLSVSGNVNNNYGTDTNLWIQYVAGSGVWMSYVRFDLSGLTGTVNSATLQLVRTLNLNTNPVTVWGLNGLNSGEAWDETTITWNNAPGLSSHPVGGTTLDLDAAQTTLLGSMSTSGSAGTTNTFSSPNLLSFLNADSDGRVTLILGNHINSGSNTPFALDEHETFAPPTLLLDVTELPPTETVPEPCSLLLAGVGLVGLGFVV